MDYRNLYRTGKQNIEDVKAHYYKLMCASKIDPVAMEATRITIEAVQECTTKIAQAWLFLSFPAPTLSQERTFRDTPFDCIARLDAEGMLKG